VRRRSQAALRQCSYKRFILTVFIVVSDDGRGLVPPGQHLSEAEKLDLIFAAGFSTAEQVSKLSGRGAMFTDSRVQDVGARTIAMARRLLADAGLAAAGWR
jgi:hypothetical protein